MTRMYRSSYSKFEFYTNFFSILYGLWDITCVTSATLLSRLRQSVQNAAARSIADLGRSACSHHRHPCQFSLAACHRASEIQAGGHRLPSTPRRCDIWLMYWDLLLTCRLDVGSGRQLLTSLMSVRHVWSLWFASAGPRLWNSLPDDITSAPSLPVFRKKLKMHLFRQSYPDIIM